VIAAGIAVAGVVWLVATKARRRSLQRHFGPEYERTVASRESRREAETELQQRRRRRRRLDIRPLSPAGRARYTSRWAAVQRRFVEAPADAVVQADSLIVEVMLEHGYPMEEFDQRVADISSDHPEAVDRYRAAHAIAVGVGSVPVETEDLRRAMVLYREVVDDLLDRSDANEERLAR
jgi:hypothetical protein